MNIYTKTKNERVKRIEKKILGDFESTFKRSIDEMKPIVKKAYDQYVKKCDTLARKIAKKNHMKLNDFYEFIEGAEEGVDKPLDEWIDGVGKIQGEIEDKFEVEIEQDEYYADVIKQGYDFRIRYSGKIYETELVNSAEIREAILLTMKRCKKW